MRARLAKLAAVSASLRRSCIEKQAGLLTAAAKAGKFALKHPLPAIGLGVTGAMAPGMTMKSYKKNMGGFDAAKQQALRGQTPVPPGVE